jgi:hypothetical protein
MPIQLDVENREGFTSNYWRVTSYNTELSNSSVYGQFQSWKSEADYSADKASSGSVMQTIVVNLGTATARGIISDLEDAAIAVGGALEGGVIL